VTAASRQRDMQRAGRAPAAVRPARAGSRAAQGAVYAVVKAAVDRGAAEGTRKLTGVWPGENAQRPPEGP
jgi:hypothetical protein